MRIFRVIFAMALLIALPAMSFGREHKVARGETFESIAKRYGVSEQALRDANPRLKNCYTGIKLAVPDPPPPPPRPKPAPAPVASTPSQPAQPAAQHSHNHNHSHNPQQNTQETWPCSLCKGTGLCFACHGSRKGNLPPLVFGCGIVFDPGCVHCGRTGKCQSCGGTGYMTRERDIYNRAVYEAQQMERQQRSSGSADGNLRYPEYQKYNDSRGNFDNRKYQQDRQANCSTCGGSGVNPYPTYTQSSRLWTTNQEGNKCPYCGQYDFHHHEKCSSCRF